MSENNQTSIHAQMQQLINEVAEQKARSEAQAKELAELVENFEGEIRIREAITGHIDFFVEELHEKVRNLELKLTKLTESEAKMLMQLSREFRRGAYEIIKGKGGERGEQAPS